MNEGERSPTKEERSIINSLIKDIQVPTLRQWLKEALEKDIAIERQLDTFHTTPELKETALKKFCDKAKMVRKIADNFPDNLIQESDKLLQPKLDKIRIGLVNLSIEAIEQDNAAVKLNPYSEINDFIHVVNKSARIGFSVKLNVFDLLANLLEKKAELKIDQFTKQLNEIISELGIFFLTNKADCFHIILNRINKIEKSGFYSEISSPKIENLFYTIIRAKKIDEKILDQFLLEQLLKLISKEDVFMLPALKDFSSNFINNCLKASLGEDELKTVIKLVYRALEKDASESKNPKYFFFKNNKKDNLSSCLINYAKMFRGLTFCNISPINYFDSDDDREAEKVKDDTLLSYFPDIAVIQSRIKKIFDSTFKEYKSSIVKEKGYREKLSEKCKELATKGKGLALKGERTLQEVAIALENTATNVTENICNAVDEIKKRNSKLEQEINVSVLLELKGKLPECQKKIDFFCAKISNSFIPMAMKSEVLANASKDVQLAGFENSSVSSSITEISSAISFIEEFIDRIIDTLVASLQSVQQEDYWFTKDAVEKIGLTKKLFNRGYLSNSVIEKLNFNMVASADFSQWKAFFLEKKFLSLLKLGIIRWPWIKKEVFARKWAEQLCLPKAKELLESLPTLLNIEQKLEVILLVSNYIDPAKHKEFYQQLLTIKLNLVDKKSEIDILNGKIDGLLRESSVNKVRSTAYEFFEKSVVPKWSIPRPVRVGFKL